MSRGHAHALGLLVMVAVGAVLYLAGWALYEATNSNPCKPWSGNRTGAVRYEGHTFTCWHGDIVGER